MTALQTPKLVIFDCDGVLVDSEELANRVLVEALARHGLELNTKEAIEAFSGYTPEDTVALAEQMLGHSLPEGFWNEMQRKTFAAFNQSLRSIAGARDLVQSLKARRIKVCVASSGAHEKMNLTLSLTDLEELFRPNIFSAEDVPQGKPAPDLFLYASRQMEIKPADCLVIEDSRPGIEAARAAGMRAILFDQGGRHGFEVGNIQRVATLGQLRKIIR